MSYIVANVSRMFESLEPWDCSNSAWNLGDNAGRITWDNALEIARERRRWLTSSVRDACENMRDWARESGGWDEAEIAAWSTDECIALFVQNIAGELRDCLDADNQDLTQCVETFNSTDWEKASESPIGNYYMSRGSVRVQYYTGI